MAALWGGGAGHAGAGGTLPLRGGADPALGGGLSSTQYLLAEDLHLASLEAETILEAGEFLETMQDYLDSSVISIIEDFSSLNETKSHMDAENELSLLTAITEILDSTDDESLSPFDTIPDSELLTSPRERENSSFQRFLSLSVSPPKKDLNPEDFTEPRLCTIMADKVEASTVSLPLSLTAACTKDVPVSKKPSSKALWGERRPFRHRERDPPVLQRSDGEEEEEEESSATSCHQGFVADVVEIPVAKEVKRDPGESDGPYVIAPESISLSELVRSMHPYCQRNITVCLSPESQPLAEELLAGPVVLEIVPEDGESIEIPVALHNFETMELSHKTDSNWPSDPVVPELENILAETNTKTPVLSRELDKQAKETSRGVLQNAEDIHIQVEEKVQKPLGDQKSRPASKHVSVSGSEKGQIRGQSKKKRKKCSEEIKRHKETINCKEICTSSEEQSKTKPSNSVCNVESTNKRQEKAEQQGQSELFPNQASQPIESLDTQEEELLKCESNKKPPTSIEPNLESAETSPHREEGLSSQHTGSADPEPTYQREVQSEPEEESSAVLPVNDMESPKASQLLPSGTVDLVEQPPKSSLCPNNEEIKEATTKEAKPKLLSLSEYRQRRQQRQSNDEGTRSIMENQSVSKWPTLPELPTELADLPCLIVPPPPTKVAKPELVKECEKPTSSSMPPPLIGKDSSTHVSLPVPTAVAVADSSQIGCLNTAAPTTVVPIPPSLPSHADAFPPVGVQVPPIPPPIPPPPYLPTASGSFLPPPPDPFILSSQPPPPVPSWPHFPPLPTSYQSLPPPPLAPEVCPPVFHMLPPVPSPNWPPPPVPLPPFTPGLPYGSMEWSLGPQPPFWTGIPVPPPVLPIAYGDQRTLMQNPPVGTLPALAPSEKIFAQHSKPLTLASSPFRGHNLAANEKPGMSTQGPGGQIPAAVKTTARRVSNPRKQIQSLAVESNAEETLSSFQQLEKPSSPISVVEPPGHVRKSSSPQALEEPPSLPPSKQVTEHTGTLKSSEEPSVLPALQQNAKEALPAAQQQTEETSSLCAPSLKEKQTMSTETDKKNASPTSPPASAVPPKVNEIGQLLKKPARTWKHQPFFSIAQGSCNKDIVQAFISEIGIEASDLSSLLEQFEKTEAKKEASNVTKARENLTLGNDGSELPQEKKMVDRLQAPELTNIAGLTPPATPPHHLWKPLAAVSLLGKPGSQKGAKPHRKAPAHVGAGEHDYCQLSAAQSNGGPRWNVKQNLDITIKPITIMAKQTPEQPAADKFPAPARLDPSGAVSITASCQNPKRAPSPADAGEDQIRASTPVTVSSDPVVSESLQLNSGLLSLHKEPLDHRTKTPRSKTRDSDGSCSVLLSPAASPCWDGAESTLQQPQEVQQKRLASKRSLRCYRGRQKSVSPQKDSCQGRRNRASQSFSSSSDGESDSSSSSSSSSCSSSSSSSSRSRSRSPPSKRWRRRRSRSSSSSSCGSSWSRSRSRSPSRSSLYSSYLSRSSSRSPSLHRRKSRRRKYASSSSRERYQRQKIRYKERAIEERRVVFIGKISSRMTSSELRHRFSIFGDIEDCTLHFREHGDNYGFVTYRYPEEAYAAIDGGQALRRPDEQPFDLCFGGRRQFCKRNYTDLDSNRDDFEPSPMKNKFDSLDFDTLLKQAQRGRRR
ncbi:peroxisome proliferator-activated receptor gamma coactivator-related protein 1 [Anolis sagrei]|uniref:peroxisome proliferator-activated receptor gamma coactivator-related protein 1 n=1 Tax=Anolis sagrei TaxID=38937 RepID=UPI0035223BAA